MGFGFNKKKAKMVLIGQLFLIILGSILLLYVCLSLIYTRYFTLVDIIQLSIIFAGSVSIILIILFYRGFLVNRVIARLVLLCSNEKYSEAQKMIDRKIKSKYLGYNVHWLSLKSMVLIKRGELEKAEIILNNIEKKYPSFLQLLYYKACLENKKDNYEDSLKHILHYHKLLTDYKESRKDPLYKLDVKKAIREFISYIKEDEDLKGVRETEEFKRIVNTFNI